MSITLADAVSDSTGVSPVSGVLTFPATVNGDFLVVCVMIRDDALLSATWNGVELTAQVGYPAVNGLRAYIRTMVAPATGTHDVVLTSAGSGPTYLAGCAISLLGVDQSSPVDDTDGMETNGANPSFSGLVTLADGDAVVDCLATNNTVPSVMNAETNRVSRSNFAANPQARYVGASTIITKSPAGSVTMGWNIGSNNSAYVAIALKAAGGVGFPFTHLKTGDGMSTAEQRWPS